MRVYRINDCDWVAAPSAEEAHRWALANEYEEEPDGCLYPLAEIRPVSDADMNRLRRGDDDLWDRPREEWPTFREALAADLADPETLRPAYLFASTEF